MRETSLTWPKLLGRIVAAIAIGLIAWQLRMWWWRYGVVHISMEWLSWVLLLVPTSLLVLSVPLYRAREWARRAVIIVGICLILLAVVRFGFSAMAASRIHDAPEITLEMRVWQVFEIIGEAGLAVCILAPHVFVLFLLRHPQVAASFVATAASDAERTI